MRTVICYHWRVKDWQVSKRDVLNSRNVFWHERQNLEIRIGRSENDKWKTLSSLQETGHDNIQSDKACLILFRGIWNRLLRCIPRFCKNVTLSARDVSARRTLSIFVRFSCILSSTNNFKLWISLFWSKVCGTPDTFSKCMNSMKCH